MVNETLADRFVSNEIVTLLLTDALVGIGARLCSPQYGLAQITALQTLLSQATTTLTNKTFDLGTNTLTGSLAEFNAALQSDEFFPLSGGVTVTGDVAINAFLVIPRQDLTISGGVITATRGSIRVDGESDSADDLDTISGAGVGKFLVMAIKNASNPITVKNNNGNLKLAGGDFIMTSPNDRLYLHGDISQWFEISRSDN